jgi:hypothetical protein
MEEGGAGTGVRAAAVWHRPRGQELITYLRRTVPTAHGRSGSRRPASACARVYDGGANVARHGATSRGYACSGSNRFKVPWFDSKFLQIL